MAFPVAMGFNAKNDWILNISVNKFNMFLEGIPLGSFLSRLHPVDVGWDLKLESCLAVPIIALEAEAHIFIPKKLQVTIRLKFSGGFSARDHLIILQACLEYQQYVKSCVQCQGYKDEWDVGRSSCPFWGRKRVMVLIVRG